MTAFHKFAQRQAQKRARRRRDVAIDWLNVLGPAFVVVAAAAIVIFGAIANGWLK